jgi:hypothetical protein
MNKNKFLSVILLSISLLFLTGCFFKKWISKEKHCGNDKKSLTPIVTVSTSNGSSDVISTYGEFDEMIKVLENGTPDLQFIALIPKEEQEKVYLKLINDYVVANFLIKKYLVLEGITNKDSFKCEYEQYMKIMESNFYAAMFQKEIAKTIIITDETAKKYYEANKETDFSMYPFVKEIPGIDAKAIKIENGKKAKDYESKLKNNKSKTDIISLEGVNRVRKGDPRLAIVYNALVEMNKGEVRSVKLENNIEIALYKVETFNGIWVPFEEIKEQVKAVVQRKELEKKYLSIISDMKIKFNVTINENIIKDFVNKKSSQQTDEKIEKAAQQIEEQAAVEEIEEKVKKEIIKTAMEEEKK